ncbi:hypothetical protein HPB52_022770 [Rhipicephalus sanguineus]|uniref:SWIM-type domain-containing protein n=1 Tax=Rhipicephalus sanguineus TaxID=34632 RepID=A0A9D4PXY8_RHISA|nr:hypothetical protein HPB52_022770 [Rhipicephalus sanguineus]
MKCYRSLKAYGLAIEGHVRKVLISSDMASSMECCFLKADVTPSQRTTAKPYEPWVLVKRDGTVSTAHCTCMAGLGEVCTHVAALLFKVELLVSSGFARSTTSQLCEWNNRFRKSQRCGRITGSIISKVVKCKSTNAALRLASKIAESPLVLFESRHRKTVAMSVGRYNQSHPEYCQLFGNIEAPVCHHFITIFQLLSEVCQED